MTTNIRIDDEGLARDAQALKNVSDGYCQLSTERVADAMTYQTAAKWGTQAQPDAFCRSLSDKLQQACDAIADLQKKIDSLVSDIHQARGDAQASDMEIAAAFDKQSVVIESAEVDAPSHRPRPSALS